MWQWPEGRGVGWMEVGNGGGKRLFLGNGHMIQGADVLLACTLETCMTL